LARRRMVAMMQHAASQSLRMATSVSDVATPLPPMDWQKADAAERALYNAIEKEMDKFKMTIGWREMQDGLRGEMEFIEPTHKPGTMQLDDFTEEALTDRAPPALVFEDEEPEPMDAFDVDEEDRIAALEWDAYEVAQDPSEHAIEEPAPPVEAPPQTKEGRHGAAMELAPSSKSAIDDDWMEEEPAVESGPKIRIRIIQSFDEPIATADGSELMLQIGDVHNLDETMANWLIESGTAEAAPL